MTEPTYQIVMALLPVLAFGFGVLLGIFEKGRKDYERGYEDGYKDNEEYWMSDDVEVLVEELMKENEDGIVVTIREE